MVEIAIPFNRRRVQFARRRQHLVNHGLQRGVNHSRQTSHHYVRLTQNIKRIPTRFCHDCRVTRHKSRAREGFEASMRSGGCAGSGRALRLDPSGLPVRFFAGDAAADGQVRDVELHRERVVMRSALRGMRMALNMPVAAFDGVSLWLMPGEAGDDDALAVVLTHRDPTLTLPLFVTSRADKALAEWRAWSAAHACRTARIFDNREGANRWASHRTSASPPPPMERAESPTALDPTQARNRKDCKRDADPSRRTRDHRRN